jgi:hypothetical protein
MFTDGQAGGQTRLHLLAVHSCTLCIGHKRLYDRSRKILLHRPLITEIDHNLITVSCIDLQFIFDQKQVTQKQDDVDGTINNSNNNGFMLCYTLQMLAAEI